MNPTANIENKQIEPTMRALRQLSPGSQGAVAALVRQLAEGEGIGMEPAGVLGLRSPAEGIRLWIAKLKAERYSPRTVHMYGYLARRYLEQDPMPTKLGVQSYLAESRHSFEHDFTSAAPRSLVQIQPPPPRQRQGEQWRSPSIPWANNLCSQ